MAALKLTTLSSVFSKHFYLAGYRAGLAFLFGAAWGSLTVIAQPTPADHDCQCDDYQAQALTAEKEGRYLDALVLLDSAMVHARRTGLKEVVASVQVRKSVIHLMLGEHNTALIELLEALRTREGLHDLMGLAEVNNNLGSIYLYQKDYERAEGYYKQSLSLYKELGLEREEAKAYNNFGALKEDQGLLEEALGFHRRSLGIWQNLRDESWMAVSYLHLGQCLEKLSEPDSAAFYFSRSASILADQKNPYLLSMVYQVLGNNNRLTGRYRQGLTWCEKALAIAEKLGAVPLQKEACECIFRAQEALGNKGEALDFYRRFILLRDSVFGQENVKEMTRIEMGNTFAQKQLADSLVQAKDRLRAKFVYEQGISRERERRNIVLISGIGVLLLAAGLWNRLLFVRRSRTVIQRERDRSDELLLNILPKAIADELKEHGRAQARDIENVSILFTDFKGFTEMSERLSAQDLVSEIDTCFKAFDAIVTEHGVEKIKTIGDAYMAAGGLSSGSTDMALATVKAALDMQDFMARYAAERTSQGKPAFTMRVGIHTGPIVAGIVGDKKFAYDIWGDTVNTASRMESSGAEGQVNISESTYALVSNANDLRFVSRGKVQAKGKGELEMYFVQRAVPSTP
ncbi:MAG: tetratricopeptide repeat protein [Flavobacteriales bacterium]|nr:tetratricopeptide repeat protein [Flavobacteriales bacterium]